ncbi:DNA-3-methyladenine glycosylase [Evansella caseinilytica]|uniref:Putative 3-methyladenine DNA glycosylase n=1 Tax=Evansella caseinilytica TaxID=1503961 RepID=A0A1H3RI01_9BACI|nr:DNA-3-methyladenine glycosylase [Evansella caseinilytica]SDZ24975.1 DNA-3-methyladenine glycosylase [Evansella caseinilytica]
MTLNQYKPVEETFFHMPTLELARHLLGKLLVKTTSAGTASGFIVETEAYIGPGDRAAHSYNDRRTARTEMMYASPGHTYTYTMHTHCLVNVVSGAAEHPEAVLIRAVEPYEGRELMHLRRNRMKKETELTNGPGKLTKALGIDPTDYGRLLTHPPLLIAEGWEPESFEVITGPRIGIENSGEAKEYPWRFWIGGNPFVSRLRKSK